MGDQMERCRKCAHLDRERSTENWVVLDPKRCPRNVIISQDSSRCLEFEPVVEESCRDQQAVADVIRALSTEYGEE